MPVPARAADDGRTIANLRLDIPESVLPLRPAWIDATGIAAIHAIALLAFVPWFFSWTGVLLALLGLYEGWHNNHLRRRIQHVSVTGGGN